MKVSINGEQVTLTSENAGDAAKLIRVVEQLIGAPKYEKFDVNEHLYIPKTTKGTVKICPMCNKSCKGKIGLGIHKRKAHNVRKLQVKHA